MGRNKAPWAFHFANGVLVGDGALDATVSTLLREHQTPDFTASGR